jgi:high-affinity nickel permease
MPTMDILAAIAPAVGAGGVGLLITALTLGLRHGFDWDHIAAIADITSTTASADAGSDVHAAQHGTEVHDHFHVHGGPDELHAHDRGPGAATMALIPPPGEGFGSLSRQRVSGEQRHAIALGTLYAFGHATVVFALGLAALAFGAVLPDWIDPIMGRVVGATLLFLGVWVFISLYQYARYGREFRLRSRWMLVFDGARHAWRRFQARLHGHEHVAPLEMTSYGPATAYGVGLIHGIGAETGTQVLLIAAIGGAAGAGLGIPMLIAFIVGLLIANTIIVVISATGFVRTQTRQRVYIAVGVLAGVFSIVVGTVFLLGVDNVLPDLANLLGAGL